MHEWQIWLHDSDVLVSTTRVLWYWTLISVVLLALRLVPWLSCISCDIGHRHQCCIDISTGVPLPWHCILLTLTSLIYWRYKDWYICMHVVILDIDVNVVLLSIQGITPYMLATCMYMYLVPWLDCVAINFCHCLLYNLAFELVNKEMATKFLFVMRNSCYTCICIKIQLVSTVYNAVDIDDPYPTPMELMTTYLLTTIICTVNI